ncbi:hypothetical protein HPB50_015434 [Hyalomma asiaticum]|uniref:Uncharacterized protein n=1 Tax=Hyalomma asiaticum TaxID=266040 RepID=A0ACB7TLE1_HYAAI|nr:hypothetical protein HPB50_015434 [Hyalomma asiaticum]
MDCARAVAGERSLNHSALRPTPSLNAAEPPFPPSLPNPTSLMNQDEVVAQVAGRGPIDCSSRCAGAQSTHTGNIPAECCAADLFRPRETETRGAQRAGRKWTAGHFRPRHCPHSEGAEGRGSRASQQHRECVPRSRWSSRARGDREPHSCTADR